MKEKNCLIFGGSGQIGRNLIRKLTKNNYRVTVVTRNIHQKSYIVKTQANAGYIDIVEANIFDENKDSPMFQTTMFGKKIENPIGMAAGFDKNAEVYNALFGLGFGFVEVGTITPLKQYGNSKPRVFRLVEDEALINRLGFNNHGAEVVLDRIKLNSKLGLLGINIGPNKDSNDRMNDYLIGLKTFHRVADYITCLLYTSPSPRDRG